MNTPLSTPSAAPNSARRSFEQALAALRDRSPDCRLVAYCDLDTRLVLRHVADPSIRQELLDRLSEEAHEAFALRAEALAALPPALATAPPDTENIRLIDDRGVRLFLRCPTDPQDALLLLCRTPACADALLPEAQNLLLAGPTDLMAGTA